MGKSKGSVARASRVNIKISDGLKGGADAELPFRMLVMGDFTMKADGRPIYDRDPLDINQSNFDSVMQKMNVSLDLSVEDRISGEGELPASLRFTSIKDFRPEQIAQQVPQLRNLVELRNALKALRPYAGDKAKQKELMSLIKDPQLRDQIMAAISSPQDAGASPAGEAEATGDSDSGPEAPTE